MENHFRCKCPITSALDIIGDKWSLVVIKQMLFEGRSTFKDFVESPEAIATNILASRLKLLEEFGLIEKHKLPTNKKTNIYVLTEKGLALTPVLIEFTLWSKYNIQDFNPNLNLHTGLDKLEQDKETGFTSIIANYNQYKRTLLNP
ncbi:winged helix-turn-helix transcriptional regulator [Reichenbachiella sp.]|uniref:winged helix-turn-helix transcriptional regulator n=1 Tax=Reichenbachiella sp. TaxID=2184521 RepID=UPI003BAEC350